jgi:hypothetical protein
VHQGLIASTTHGLGRPETGGFFRRATSDGINPPGVVLSTADHSATQIHDLVLTEPYNPIILGSSVSVACKSPDEKGSR